MSSSDSDDDCYGNIAQKLQSLKNQYVEEKAPVDSLEVENSNLLSKEDSTANDLEDCNTTLNSTDNDEWSLDAIIAKNTAPKRGRKRKAPEPTAPIANTRSRRRTANSNKTTDDTAVLSKDFEDISAPLSSRRRKTGTNSVSVVDNTSSTNTRGRTGGSRGSAANRGRGRVRNRRNNSSRRTEQLNIYPTYSIGNTEEYLDLCDNQELFSSSAPKNNDVDIIDDEDPLADDNEELSVKVYWQSFEVVRFKIRKYQKLKPLFKYFCDRENVSVNKLLFMYNDRIVKMDDTPDVISYSIAKFIEGGIVEQDVTQLTKQNNAEINDGLKIKFQCQHLKKPFETTITPEDKLALAMMKCAEHLETQIENLKFYFDGDLISSKTTAEELELEGGECIDVKIVS